MSAEYLIFNYAGGLPTFEHMAPKLIALPSMTRAVVRSTIPVSENI